jgi:RNase P subunit RPR2
MDTCCYHHYEICKKCGSSNLEKVKTEPVKIGRMVDHKLSFRCKDCGEITVIGVKEL